MIYRRLLPENASKLTLSTPESQATSRLTISNGRSHSCEAGFPATRLSRISAAASTLKEKVCEKYWNSRSADVSRNSWLPTETDCAVLASSLSDGLSRNTVEDSWFSTTLYAPRRQNSSPISCPSSTSLGAALTACARTVRKSKKIRFYPSKDQRQKIKLWMASARKAYNATIELLRNHGTAANWIAIKVGIINALPEWTSACPYQIKSLAIKDACLAVKAAKIKAKTEQRFIQVGFRSRRDFKMSLFIPKAAVKPGGAYVRLLGKLRMTEEIPLEIRHDCRMCYDYGRYYLIVPVDVAVQAQPASRGVVSLDPGVRTFQTFYSADLAGKFGAGDFGRIYRLCCCVDKLLSMASKARHAKRRRLRKAAARLRDRIRHCID